MRFLDTIAVVLIAVMMLGPLALAPAYGPYVAPGTAAEVEEATTPFSETPAEDAAALDSAQAQEDIGG